MSFLSKLFGARKPQRSNKILNRERVQFSQRCKRSSKSQTEDNQKVLEVIASIVGDDPSIYDEPPEIYIYDYGIEIEMSLQLDVNNELDEFKKKFEDRLRSKGLL